MNKLKLSRTVRTGGLGEVQEVVDLVEKLHKFKDIMLIINNRGEILNYYLPEKVSTAAGKPEFLNFNIRTLLPESAAEKLFSQIYENGGNNYISDIEYTHPINSVNKVFQGRIVPLPDSRYLFNLKDITGYRRAEEALLQTEMRFRSVWENSIDGMRLLDRNGNIVAANNAYSKLVELKSEEYLGKSYSSIYISATSEVSDFSMMEFQNKFTSREIEPFFQSESVFRSGKNAVLEVSNVFIESGEEFEGDVLLLSIFRDITERRKAEEYLRKSDKLAAIGKMAAYLSHEIKTPLASIKMNIDMITREPDLSEKKQKSLFIIQKEIKRLNKLLRNVLQYSSNYDLHIVRINLDYMLNNLKDFLELQLSEKNILFINDVHRIKINGDYQKLQSVFLHLIENSIEAVPLGGKIEIYAEEDEEDNLIRIFIKDNGCGIKSNDHIFEPFYTTKNTGTGLGLAIAQRIIDQHNGELKLYSTHPGETIFVIIFHNFGL